MVGASSCRWVNKGGYSESRTPAGARYNRQPPLCEATVFAALAEILKTTDFGPLKAVAVYGGEPTDRNALADQIQAHWDKKKGATRPSAGEAP